MPKSLSKTRNALLAGGSVVVIAGAAGFFVLTSPLTWSLTHPSRDVADAGAANLENGREIFIAGDCATCHATPGQKDPLKLGGGRALDTAFGRFYMPNISPDPKDGIGAWSLADFTRAMREGVGPGGRNLYPAFPYTSYQRLTANDVRDMFAYIKSLPPVAGKAPDHQLKFPFNIRRGIGVWRLAFLDGQPIGDAADAVKPAKDAKSHDELLARGRYLVEGPGHCAECHSPRSFMGNVIASQRYGGGSTPDGKNFFPNISPDETGIGYWSINSIVNYLQSGISPINKRAGGDMAEVVENTTQLPRQDLLAMAFYLKSLPPVDLPAPGMPEPNYTDQVVMLKQAAKKAEILPVSPAAEIAAADTVYVVSAKPFYLDESKVGKDGAEDGKLLGAAKLAVVGRDGDKLKVRLDGWQMDGAGSVFYAQQSQRIMQAVLSEAAIGSVQKQPTVEDAQTHQKWTPSSLTVWIDAKALNAHLPELWAYSAKLFNNSCSVCHVLPESQHFLANQWIGNLKAMQRFTSFSDDQYRLLLAYLQNHSKDVGADKGAQE